MAQVIRQVSSDPVGKNRLTLQLICRKDGIRAICPVWEQQDSGGSWKVMNGVPQFNSKFWVQVISRAAVSGLLGSQAYKDLVVNLARGLDSSKPQSSQAVVRVLGELAITVGNRQAEARSFPINSSAIYYALVGTGREVAFSSSYVVDQQQTILTCRVQEDMHLSELVDKLPPNLQELVVESSVESVFDLHPLDVFTSVFGPVPLDSAGFTAAEVSYRVSVI